MHILTYMCIYIHNKMCFFLSDRDRTKLRKGGSYRDRQREWREKETDLKRDGGKERDRDIMRVRARA